MSLVVFLLQIKKHKKMRKVLYISVVTLFFGLTSCESSDLNNEINELEELQTIEPGDDGTIDPGDDDDRY